MKTNRTIPTVVGIWRVETRVAPMVNPLPSVYPSFTLNTIIFNDISPEKNSLKGIKDFLN